MLPPMPIPTIAPVDLRLLSSQYSRLNFKSIKSILPCFVFFYIRFCIFLLEKTILSTGYCVSWVFEQRTSAALSAMPPPPIAKRSTSHAARLHRCSVTDSRYAFLYGAAHERSAPISPAPSGKASPASRTIFLYFSSVLCLRAASASGVTMICEQSFVLIQCCTCVTYN